MNTTSGRITMDPAICHGRPTIRGLRYPVEMILELLGSGMSHAEITDDYEDLESEDILAVLEYAARVPREAHRAALGMNPRNPAAGATL